MVLQRLYYDGFTHSLVSGGKNDDTIVETLHQRPAHAAVWHTNLFLSYRSYMSMAYMYVQVALQCAICLLT